MGISVTTVYVNKLFTSLSTALGYVRILLKNNKNHKKEENVLILSRNKKTRTISILGKKKRIKICY